MAELVDLWYRGSVWCASRSPEALSSAHTLASGHRLADILHIATALHLGVAEFLAFDENQKKLAEAEGLMVPV